MRWSSLLFLVASLFSPFQSNAQTVYYATQGFTPPGGCASSTSGSLNVLVTLPVPVGSNEVEIRQANYALRGTTSQPSTVKIIYGGYSVSANPQTSATACCSSSSCDLVTYTVSTLGQSWYESPCGKPTCGTAQQWYKLSFPSNSLFYSVGTTSIGVNVDFNGGFMDLANFGSGSSFFISYHVYFPSPSPTPTRTTTTTKTPTPTITETPTPTESPSPSSTSSGSASSTVTASSSATPTNSASVSSSPTPSTSSTNTPSVSPSITPSSSSTNTPSISPSSTSTITSTNTPSVSSTTSSSISITQSTTITPTSSVSSTISPTASLTNSPSVQASPSPSFTSSASSSATPSVTISATPSFSLLQVSRPPTMSDPSNSTITYLTQDGESSMATILSGTTVGITGLAAVTYLLNYLRRSGALNFLRSVGINIPVSTTAKTEEEKKAEQEGANSVLGKAATLINKVKDEREEILKVVDSLPLSDQLKYAAHNPKSLLSKGTQAKLENAQKDLEKGLSNVARVSRSPSPVAAPATTPKLDEDAMKILRQYAEMLSVQLPERLANLEQKRNTIVEPEQVVEEGGDLEVENTQEEDQEVNEIIGEQTQVEVAPVPAPAPVAAPTKKTRVTKREVQLAKKATLEVNENELAEIKLILANKKKQFNVV